MSLLAQYEETVELQNDIPSSILTKPSNHFTLTKKILSDTKLISSQDSSVYGTPIAIIDKESVNSVKQYFQIGDKNISCGAELMKDNTDENLQGNNNYSCKSGEIFESSVVVDPLNFLEQCCNNKDSIKDTLAFPCDNQKFGLFQDNGGNVCKQKNGMKLIGSNNLPSKACEEEIVDSIFPSCVTNYNPANTQKTCFASMPSSCKLSNKIENVNIVTELQNMHQTQHCMLQNKFVNQNESLDERYKIITYDQTDEHTLIFPSKQNLHKFKTRICSADSGSSRKHSANSLCANYSTDKKSGRPSSSYFNDQGSYFRSGNNLDYSLSQYNLPGCINRNSKFSCLYCSDIYCKCDASNLQNSKKKLIARNQLFVDTQNHQQSVDCKYLGDHESCRHPCHTHQVDGNLNQPFDSPQQQSCHPRSCIERMQMYHHGIDNEGNIFPSHCRLSEQAQPHISFNQNISETTCHLGCPQNSQQKTDVHPYSNPQHIRASGYDVKPQLAHHMEHKPLLINFGDQHKYQRYSPQMTFPPFYAYDKYKIQNLLAC